MTGECITALQTNALYTGYKAVGWKVTTSAMKSETGLGVWVMPGAGWC